jgi:K+-sensing histidine kinase KdpD
MDNREERFGVWVPLGALGAMALSIALMPLRSVTSASNLAFAFLPWTILVAELGGRSAGLVTALVAAMSLNFFLTEPYLTLAISKTEDVIAFVALAVCGLIAAAFGGRRERWSAAARRAHTYQDALGRLVAHLDHGDPLHSALEDLRQAFGLGRIVVRDADGRVRAAAPAAADPPPRAEAVLAPDTLSLVEDSYQRWGRQGFRLPESGGRLPLPMPSGAMTIELWEGSPDGLSLEARRAIWLAAALLRRELAAAAPTR